MLKFVGFFYLLYSAIVFIVLMVMVCPFILIAMASFRAKPARQISFLFLKIWAWSFSFLTFLWFVSSSGKDIDTSKSYIYVGNHSSYLDAIAIVVCIPQPFSPLGKIEMLKVPIFGWIYKRMVVVIDRSSRESRDQSLAVLRENLVNGQSILLFPEGTINKTSETLRPFFDGAFRLAIETQTPLIPFAILNSKAHLPQGNPFALKPGKVKMIFSKPISVNGLTLDDLPALKDQVYHEILQQLKK
ncbi:lysophospholipid acyltransferase family protein [Pedobacter sandarakinus]|uniref:lysophospholipid acyltransferase family protein n=1 Tax=Pedobacter sandarakinus TaxID=353156 RepID=UPI002246D8B4|nr:lysophospholipid acyltransferase family protein [Pedobacter sandarakinus]MCX2576117.1 lysophospholipid acyltransferase family protein [Pedobacter sandarakinus]